jgi:CMP-N-acetylneuraminic acid synthetase
LSDRGLRRLALIPARGGSKRLPRKNVIDFRGRPIIAYTIEAARTTGLFTRVVVSTEDAEIAKTAVASGAEVDMRPVHLATDTAGVTDVCFDLLGREQEAGRAYDQLCVLYATAPLRGSTDIAATVGLLKEGECDFALAVTDYPLPPHQALRLEAGNIVRPMWPDLIDERSDAIGRLCVDNGSTYAVSVPAFLRERTFYGAKLKAHTMGRLHSVDIDTADDLAYARFAAEQLEGRS